jgi:hypothetical protein
MLSLRPTQKKMLMMAERISSHSSPVSVVPQGLQVGTGSLLFIVLHLLFYFDTYLHGSNQSSISPKPAVKQNPAGLPFIGVKSSTVYAPKWTSTIFAVLLGCRLKRAKALRSKRGVTGWLDVAV